MTVLKKEQNGCIKSQKIFILFDKQIFFPSPVISDRFSVQQLFPWVHEKRKNLPHKNRDKTGHKSDQHLDLSDPVSAREVVLEVCPDLSPSLPSDPRRFDG